MNEPNGGSVGDSKTYRGGSLEELLPQIREELGPDALITRQRDGIVGGIGGFFGKKTVEVEARPARPLYSATSPDRAVPRLDVYDASEAEVEQARPAPGGNRLLDELYRQASPFAERLIAAELELDEPFAPEPADELAPEPAPEPDPEPVAPRFVAAPIAAVEPAPEPRPLQTEAAGLRSELAAAGVPSTIAAAVVAEAEAHKQVFDRLEPLAAHVRTALAGRIRTKQGWKSARRTIALVGPPGAGRTLTAAKLCHAYADGTDMSVVALSAERASKALRLGTHAERIGVDFEIAASPAAMAEARRDLRRHQLVIADLPPVEAGDAESIGHTVELLEALRPQETHLVVPASMRADSVRVLLQDLQARTRVDRLLITHADDRPGGGAVGAALASRIPVSYVADGAQPASGIHPARAAELAALVVR